MKKQDCLYLQEIDNLVRMVGCVGKDFNMFLFTIMGLNNKAIISILYFISPALYVLNIVFTIIYLVIAIIWSIIKSPFKKALYLPDNLSLFLFFVPLLYGRCKAAKLYESSIYWVIGPNVDKSKYDLSGKTAIDYRELLFVGDYLKIFYMSLSTVYHYIGNYKCLYAIYRTWEFYEVQLALEKISTNSTMYFANQSDRWALLFDSIPSKMKVMVQHGVAPTEFEVPHKLSHIDVFYSISDQTWEDAYKTILNCQPELILMEPTISLTDIDSDKLKILIISLIMNYDLEKKLIEYLQGKDVEIYVKKHPSLRKDECYTELLKSNNFNYIRDDIFPKVDFVISYYSTLAYEYITLGIPVYLYNSKEEFSMTEVENEIKNLKK